MLQTNPPPRAVKPGAPAGEYLSGATEPEGAPPPAQGCGWFRAMRGSEPMELIKANPLAYVLAAVIAHRGQYRIGGFNRYNLKPGEALLGDHENCGMTSREYRTAKQQLAKWQFATFRTTNKGTIGKLIDTRLFSIFRLEADNQDAKQATSKRQASDNQDDNFQERRTERTDRAKELIERDARLGKEAEEKRPAGNIGGMVLQLGEPAARGEDWHGMSLNQKLLKLLGAGEASDARWARRAQNAPEDLGEILDKMHADLLEGRIIKNRGAYAERLWQVSRKFNG